MNNNFLEKIDYDEIDLVSEFKKFRKEAGLSQARVAEIVGAEQCDISLFENYKKNDKPLSRKLIALMFQFEGVIKNEDKGE